MPNEFTRELMFRNAKNDEKMWVTYTLRPGSPVYFGRERIRALIEANYPHATYVSPNNDKRDRLLSGRQAHGVAEWLNKGERSAPEVGFYLRIFARRNGEAPTNPLWVLDRSGRKDTWKETTFNKDELFPLNANDRFCIGRSFHIKVGQVSSDALLNNVAPAPAPASAPAALLNDVATAVAAAPAAQSNDDDSDVDSDVDSDDERDFPCGTYHPCHEIPQGDFFVCELCGRKSFM